MLAHIITPNSYPIDKNIIKPLGFNPAKKRCNSAVWYTLSIGEKAEWEKKIYNRLTPVTYKVAERAENIVSWTQVACYLRWLIWYNQQKIKRIIIRKKMAHM